MAAPMYVLSVYFQRFLPLLLFTEWIVESAVLESCDLEIPFFPYRLNHVQCHKEKMYVSFEKWKFSFPQVLANVFPLDTINQNYVREVKNCLFSVTYPIPFKTRTQLIAFSESALAYLLDLETTAVKSQRFVDFVSGTFVLPGSTPLSHRYGGHQFGYWADQLGDGRAVMLGEYVNRYGERWELQLKGSGLTPYSRRGDGRAVLRSSVREFLGSEAMYHLGIPTSRAATLVVSDDPIMRDQFYDGHPKTERGAIVLRLAPSWFRIGSLEILTEKGEYGLLKKLTDFVIEQYFPHIEPKGEDKYLVLYSTIIQQTVDMIVKWQSVGFTHGVCNTDNYSLLSITIDYGPFGFLDEYDPSFIPNTSDDEGRYDYQKQPEIGQWNLDKLRISMLPLLRDNQKKQMADLLNGYSKLYKKRFLEIFTHKLGLTNVETDDDMFIGVLLKMMEDRKADFTMTFRELSEINIQTDESSLFIPNQFWALKTLSKHEWFQKWIKIYKKRLVKENIDERTRQLHMTKVNPRYVLRNWMAQSAIEKAEKNDFSEVRLLLRILERPFDYQPEAEEAMYASPPPWWAKSLKVSCSS